MTIDPQSYRETLGAFATGVTVVTGVMPEDGRPAGVTVSSFAAVSLAPPLILFCLGRGAACFDAFVHGERFAINVLTEDQLILSERFASRTDDKFEDVTFVTGASGCPLLPACLATLECTRTEVHDGGDHVIIIGRIDRMQRGEGRPLLHFRGGYDRIAPHA